MPTKVNIFNQSIGIETDDVRLKEHIHRFLNNFYKQDTNQYTKSPYAKPSPDKVFANVSKCETSFIVHRNQFLHLLSYLEQVGYDLSKSDKVDLRNYPVASIDIPVNEGWVPYPKQELAINFLLDPPKYSKLLPTQTGSGKDSPLSTLIKIPGGWSTMGQMKVGTKVVAKDGTTCNVIGVHPQGLKACYKITFADGRTAICGGGHLWKIYYTNARPTTRERVITTLDIQKLKSIVTPRLYIDLIDPEIGDDIELPMDPYILGVLLGDGYLGDRGISVTKNDMFVKEKMDGLLPEKLCTRIRPEPDKLTWAIMKRERYSREPNEYITVLKELGIYDKRSYEKFIPDIYFDASYAQRICLIQGLLDTDGTVDQQGTVSFCSTSYLLAKQVEYLIRSTGGIAFTVEKNPTYTYNGSKFSGRKAYQVNIRHKTPSILFSLPRKKERTKDFGQYNETLKLRIEKVEYVGEMETQCISIDHPDHLYVVDDFVVTHNSLMSMATLSRKGVRAGICILPTYIEKTVGDMTKILNVKAKDIMVIQGSSSLVGLIDMAKEGRFNSPFTVFSSTTMSNFNKGYEDEKEFTLDKYGISPIELFPLLEIGVLLIDETHQHFHIMFKQILNSNVKSLIGMSATFISDDKFISRMHRLVYPSGSAYENFGHTKYIDIYSIGYSINPDYHRQVRTTEFNSTFYSHTAYEQSIHKIPYLRKRYYNLIRITLDDYFLSEYKQGDRFMVFVSTVVMATEVTEYLKEAYPLLDIRRYVEKDPYENLTDPDGRVTTVISAGTNKDIKNLRVAVSTISISSSASNLQVIGRLRELPDRDVKFCQLYWEGSPKHQAYRKKRAELFQGKVKSIFERRSRVNV